jgi:hypothetical protein
MTDDVQVFEVTERDTEEALARFFAAEQAENGDRADMSLRDAFEAVPRRHPSPGLTERLMRSAMVRPAPPATPKVSERTVAAGVVAAALGMTLMPVAVVGALFVFDAARIVSWIARACVWLTDWLNAGLSIWELLARSGGALGHAANSPIGSAALTITLLIASMALLVLNRYLPTERS